MEEICRVEYNNHIDDSYIRTLVYVADEDSGAVVNHTITSDILEQEASDPQPVTDVEIYTEMSPDRPSLLHKLEEDLFNVLSMYSRQLLSLEIYPKDRGICVYEDPETLGYNIRLEALTHATSEVSIHLDITAVAPLVKESELLRRLVDTLSNNPKFDIPIRDRVYGLKIEWQGKEVVLPSQAEDTKY